MATKTLDAAIAARKKVTDGAYVPIMQTDGTLAQIAMADLAKVAGGLSIRIPASSTTLIYKLADMRANIQDTFEIFLEHLGLRPADFGLLSLRGEKNNKDNKFTLKVLNGAVNVYTNADKSAVYLELDSWTRAIFISIGGSVNLSPVKVDIDKSTLTLIKPS